MKTLFGKDSKGNIKEWRIEVTGDTIAVHHGKLNGKMQTKLTVCKGKNIGRANETSPEVQAIKEAEAKITKQYKRLYRDGISDLENLDSNLPMLAHDYTKVGHRMSFPCAGSPKLDGVRALARITASEVILTSRGGEQYDVPDNIELSLLELYRRVKSDTLALEEETLILDGELYIHGLPLQDINSCVTKPNENTPLLTYSVFDVPHTERPWDGRYVDLIDLSLLAVDLPAIRFVPNVLIESPDQVESLHDYYVSEGYEGLMLRSLDGLYKYNHRSSGLMKYKKFKDTEAVVLSVVKDKNGEAVLQCSLQDGAQFECKMKGNHAFRSYENLKDCAGSFITIKYQQLTKDGVPQFPVGLSFRKLNEKWEPII